MPVATSKLYTCLPSMVYTVITPASSALSENAPVVGLGYRNSPLVPEEMLLPSLPAVTLIARVTMLVHAPVTE